MFNFSKKIPIWLVGGLFGLIYFGLTYYIDIGRCNIYGTAFQCSGATGLMFMLLNYPSVLILGTMGFLGIAAGDLLIGSVLGYLVGKFIISNKETGRGKL